MSHICPKLFSLARQYSFPLRYFKDRLVGHCRPLPSSPHISINSRMNVSATLSSVPQFIHALVAGLGSAVASSYIIFGGAIGSAFINNDSEPGVLHQTSTGFLPITASTLSTSAMSASSTGASAEQILPVCGYPHAALHMNCAPVSFSARVGPWKMKVLLIMALFLSFLPALASALPVGNGGLSHFPPISWSSETSSASPKSFEGLHLATTDYLATTGTSAHSNRIQRKRG